MADVINSRVRLSESYDAAAGVHQFAMLRWNTTTLAWEKFAGSTAGIAADVTVLNWPGTQAISAASLPLPSGASTSAAQTTGNTSLSTLADAIVTNGAVKSMRASNGLAPIGAFDYFSQTQTSSTVETIVYKTGGAGGSTVKTIVITYSNAAHDDVVSVVIT